MHAAAVALVYDITAKEAHPASGSKHDHEEKHCSSIAVMKVYEGKIAQTDLVVCVAFPPCFMRILSSLRAHSWLAC